MSESQKESLLISLGRKGWRQREPFDDDVEPECPRFFARACQMIVSELILPRTQVLDDIGLDRSDVEAILGLHNFFDEAPPAGVEEPQPVLKFLPVRVTSGSFSSGPPPLSWHWPCAVPWSFSRPSPAPPSNRPCAESDGSGVFASLVGALASARPACLPSLRRRAA